MKTRAANFVLTQLPPQLMDPTQTRMRMEEDLQFDASLVLPHLISSILNLGLRSSPFVVPVPPWIGALPLLVVKFGRFTTNLKLSIVHMEGRLWAPKTS